MPKRVDANQPRIVRALRRKGLLVHVASELGRGFPDLVVGDPLTSRVWLCEVKNPEERWGLTEPEARFHELWQGMVHVVETAEDVLELVGYSTTRS